MMMTICNLPIYDAIKLMFYSFPLPFLYTYEQQHHNNYYYDYNQNKTKQKSKCLLINKLSKSLMGCLNDYVDNDSCTRAHHS
ncbi:hypothetical protein DERP_004953 [Dermatophagoides pteronyssinus]|uniref:Uncharacterized protein n=1 Tax=Dermatophagoides pteronyssinus TaxID=6956 RepID=A0ABQ8JSY8_DERPT|nr:hypothetical protein DERP_004953 [Dermatophagoides pteronyssinus]